MTSTLFLQVSTYIDENIYHSSVWDEATELSRNKAINNCLDLLLSNLKRFYKNKEDIPLNILANQVIWFMRIDDTFLRAEMGASYIQMSGVMINIKDKDRSIAPYVLDALGITPDSITGGIPKRKVGSYIGRQVGTSESVFRRR